MDFRKTNQVLESMKSMLEETSIMSPDLGVITEDDVEQILEEERGCSEIVPCGPLGDGDEINQFISSVIDQFVEQGISEEDAQVIIFDTMEEAISSGKLGDTPDLDASEEEKRDWILSFDRLMEERNGTDIH